jgi:N-acetyl-anhydromuramyl-L-alanine amidase AmpD
MRNSLMQAVAILLFGLTALILSMRAGDAQFLEGQKLMVPRFRSEPLAQIDRAPLAQTPQNANDPHNLLSRDCAFQPSRNPSPPTRAEMGPVQVQLGLDRFRSPSGPDPNAPKEVIGLAHPTNFGQRYQLDLNGKAIDNAPIVVLHETTSSAASALGLFQTPHSDDDDQVSYHTMIDLDGTVIYVVPPDRRAYGAANSFFSQESVRTSPNNPPSVNNFAYHISLVTPKDGRGRNGDHSGYSDAQYESLAWLASKTGISPSRMTAHRLVDRSGSRSDPRSFDGPRFLARLQAYPATSEISLACAPVSGAAPAPAPKPPALFSKPNPRPLPPKASPSPETPVRKSAK